MTTLFFLVPPVDIDAADRQDHYWQPYFEIDRKRTRKKEFRIVKVGRTVEAEPLFSLPLEGFAKDLTFLKQKVIRQANEEQIILHLIMEDQL